MKTNLVPSLLGILLLVAIVLVLFWLWSRSGSLDARATREDLTTRLMQRKTAAAIDIRAALATEDLRRVERGVTELRRIGETSNWFLPDERYAGVNNDFRQALDRLETALAQRSTTQLKDAYTALTQSCISCHQQVAPSQIDPTLLQLDGE